MDLIRLEMRKWTKNRTEEILVSNSSPVSGLYEASGVKSTWSRGFQESPRNRRKKIWKIMGNRPINSLAGPWKVPRRPRRSLLQKPRRDPRPGQNCSRESPLSDLFFRFLVSSRIKPSIDMFSINFQIVSDSLGRLQRSKTTIQKTTGTLRVDKSSSP